MSFLRTISPLRAINDLRAFLAQRRPYEVVFLFLSIMITCLIVVGFTIDSRVEMPYHRNIQYFENWRLDRTDAQIIAQQKIDGVEQTRRENQLKKQKAEMQASFKRMDDKLTKMGF